MCLNSVLFLFINIKWFFVCSFVSVLGGTMANFINIIAQSSDAYCGACGALVGSALSNGCLEIRSQHLIRIDPRWLVSVCLGQTRENGVLISHQHFPLMATFINLPTAPILPLQIRSIRNGMLLSETCPFARDFIENPPSAPFSEQFFTNNRVPTREFVNLTGSTQSTSESVTEDAIDKLTNELLDYDTSSLNDTPFVCLAPPNTPLYEENRLDVGDDPLAGESISNVPVLDNIELSAYLQDQPSTSSSRYDPEVEAVRFANELNNRQYTNSTPPRSKRFKPDYWSAICDHGYGKSVSNGFQFYTAFM